MPVHISTERGYTLIEIMVSLALLSAVAVPLALLLADSVTKSVNTAAIDAAAVAANLMEEQLLTRRFEDSTMEVNMGGQKYGARISCRRQGDLFEVSIAVGKENDGKELFRLYRFFYDPVVGPEERRHAG